MSMCKCTCVSGQQGRFCWIVKWVCVGTVKFKCYISFIERPDCIAGLDLPAHRLSGLSMLQMCNSLGGVRPAWNESHFYSPAQIVSFMAHVAIKGARSSVANMLAVAPLRCSGLLWPSARLYCWVCRLSSLLSNTPLDSRVIVAGVSVRQLVN